MSNRMHQAFSTLSSPCGGSQKPHVLETTDTAFRCCGCALEVSVVEVTSDALETLARRGAVELKNKKGE